MKLMSSEILLNLTDVVMVGLKEIPGVGAVIEYKDRRDMAQKMCNIFGHCEDLSQRIAALEALVAIPPADIEAICQPHLQGSPEQNKFALEVVKQIAQKVTRKTASTKHLGMPKLNDEEEFYLDLIPDRRPHDYTGQEVVHRPRWILQELIGAGGMGEVWRACHVTLPECEAIKFCHEESQRAFLQREVDTLKRVQQLPQHPNIVRLKDVNLDQAPYWLAFEYVTGGTLLDLMQQRHLAWSEALVLMRGIAEGVTAAHALGIIHRDLKPANILLTVDGIPKVTDFGLGKIIEPTDVSTRLGMGTQDYASPEQVKGKRGDPADDVYALGVILWHLAAHTFEPPQFLRLSLDQSRLPKTAQQLIRDCIELPRGHRPADAGVFLQRLRELPSTLAEDTNLEQLRQQAEQAREQAQEAKESQFAQQLQAQEHRAKQMLSPFAPPTTTNPQSNEYLARQWRELQHLATDIPRLLAKALKDLGEFRSVPRDEEFEYQNEYEERLAQEQAQYAVQRQAIIDHWQRTEQEILARLQAVRHSFCCTELTDWRYDLDKQTLYCQGIIKDLLPSQHALVTLVIPDITREHARHYRTNPKIFQLHGNLILQIDPPALLVTEAYVELVGEGLRFPTQAQLTLKTGSSTTTLLASSEPALQAVQNLLSQVSKLTTTSTIGDTTQMVSGWLKNLTKRNS